MFSYPYTIVILDNTINLLRSRSQKLATNIRQTADARVSAGGVAIVLLQHFLHQHNKLCDFAQVSLNSTVWFVKMFRLAVRHNSFRHRFFKQRFLPQLSLDVRAYHTTLPIKNAVALTSQATSWDLSLKPALFCRQSMSKARIGFIIIISFFDSLSLFSPNLVPDFFSFQTILFQLGRLSGSRIFNVLYSWPVPALPALSIHNLATFVHRAALTLE